MIIFKKVIPVVCILLFYFQAQGQFKSKIPLDPTIKQGVLENGMQYFIKQNSEPEQRVSFYFAQNVGAILEEDHQNGLAHFLEHMAFNGTKHFEEKGIFDFLEPHGVKFGDNINAFTGHDETVYNISNVPVGIPGLLDSCLLVLHDWSGYLSLTDKEIDAERGVIREEWRTRRNVYKRLQDQQAPVIYPNSKYEKRDVIGSLDVINNFSYKDLRDYYNMWYRPDQQAVIVVGDINVKKMEKLIKSRFSDIPLKENLTEREYYEIPNHKEVLYTLATDKEQNSVSIDWMFREDTKKTKDENLIRNKLIAQIFNTMFNNRCREVTQKSSSSALSMNISNGNLVRLKDYYALSVSPKSKKEKEAFELILTELERVKKHGFTLTELERTKKNFMRAYENALQTQDEVSNEEWAQKIYEYFLKSTPLMSIEDEVKLGIKHIYSIRLDEVNKMVDKYLSENNSGLIVSGPQKKDMVYPTKEELLEISVSVKKKKIEPYVDEAISGPLMSNALEDVQLVGQFEVEGTTAKGYQLNNGATFVLMPTDFSEEQILFSAFSFGGLSVVDTNNLISANVVNTISDVSGAGAYTQTQLMKILSGKLVSIYSVLSNFSEGFNGIVVPQDLEILLQILYLSFESPHFDKEAFEVKVEALRTEIANRKGDPSYAFQDSVTMVANNYHPRTFLINEDFLNKIDFEKAVEIYKQRYNDASDFVFFFVGDINEEDHLPLIARYIGNITSTNKSEAFRNNKVLPPEGEFVRVFEMEMDVPKTSVFYSISGKKDYSFENNILLSIVADLLEKRYLKVIREEKGGTYDVQVREELSKYPEERFLLDIIFDCDPEKQEQLREILKEEIKKIVDSGSIETDLNKIKKNYIKLRKEWDNTNEYWIMALSNSITHQVKIRNLEQFTAYIESISTEKIHEFVNELFKETDTIELVMNPK